MHSGLLLLAVVFPLSLLACSGGAESSPGSFEATATSSTSAGAGGAGGAMNAASSTDSGIGGGFTGAGGAPPATSPVRTIPGLTSISFHERTGGTEPTAYTFLVDGPELTVRLPDPLVTWDIPGAASEYYDVYYSDHDGLFDIDGSYLTISGVFGNPLPAGGGLNLAEIGLNFEDASTEYGNYVASYQVLGDNSVESAVPNCIDGDLQTHTTMGNTVGTNERLRLTLGFESSSGPPPR
jgi:hypothetical protein